MKRLLVTLTSIALFGSGLFITGCSDSYERETPSGEVEVDRDVDLDGDRETEVNQERNMDGTTETKVEEER